MDNVNKEVVEFYKKLGYTLIDIKSSVFREEESTLVFQTDNKNHTVDGSTILYDHAVAIHQQLQKARQDWLQEEIVRLEGMKVKNEHNSECLHNEAPEYCDCDNYIKWNKALQTIIDRYHSELDQDTELLNSVKEDWDKQAKNAMNGLDQEVSK